MRLRASAASQRDPAESAEVTIAIEEAGLCDGSECGIAVPIGYRRLNLGSGSAPQGSSHWIL
jgi:hypothetical protein